MDQNLPKLSKDSMPSITVPHAGGQSSSREWLSRRPSRLRRRWFDLPIAALAIWFAVMTYDLLPVSGASSNPAAPASCITTEGPEL
jgi:hypothetical protein